MRGDAIVGDKDLDGWILSFLTVLTLYCLIHGEKCQKKRKCSGEKNLLPHISTSGAL
jgi:hypothetical protein